VVKWGGRLAIAAGVGCVLIAAGAVVLTIYRQVTVTPAERVVLIETTACGQSSRTFGTGVVVAPDRVLTAAHTVSGAGEVSLLPARASSSATIGRVVAYDQRSDLALLTAADFEGGAVELAEVEAGDEVVAFRWESDELPATVTKRVEIRIEGVRSSKRGSRFGFLLDADVDLGDSGAPVFDSDDRLVGIVFGRSAETEGRTFAVRAEEIEAILALPETEWVCDPDANELVTADE